MDLKKRALACLSGMKIRNLFFAVCLVLAGLATVAPYSRAGEPESPCDPEYMDALEARAWLEAQREIAQNQNLIYKPDSVLEYTCFDFFLNEAASNFAPNRQFSETDRWDGPPTGFSETSTDEALTEVVLFPMQHYLDANFNTLVFNAGAYLNNRTTIEYGYQGAVDGGTAYDCNQMAAVWNVARCTNFDSEVDFDGFYDFAYYEEIDPRTEENEWDLMCEDPDPRIADARIAAFNEDQDLFDVGTEIIPAEGNGEPYLEDDVITHLDLILPDPECLGPAIETGISVQRPDINGGAPYPERVCTNPGCSNTPDTTDCVP